MGVEPVRNAQMKFTKTETEYNMKSIRFLLLTITSMFIVVAVLMIVLGISVYSHYHNFSYFYESAKSGRFFTPSVLSVFLGLMLLVVSSFGFFGSLKMSTCMVNLYALILTLMLLVKLTVVILAFTIDTDSVLNYLYIPVENYATDPEIQQEMDQLQTTLNCCGANSYLDYMGMEFNGNHSTVVITKESDSELVTMVIPESCCVTSGQVFCARMWSNSCKTALVSVLVQNSSVLGVLGVSVMFINLLGIIFALLLARCIRKLKSERALMLWKIKEQMILARQAEEVHKKESQMVYVGHNESSVA